MKIEKSFANNKEIVKSEELYRLDNITSQELSKMSPRELEDLFDLANETDEYDSEIVHTPNCSKVIIQSKYKYLKSRLEAYYLSFYTIEESLANYLHGIFCKYRVDEKCTWSKEFNGLRPNWNAKIHSGYLSLSKKIIYNKIDMDKLLYLFEIICDKNETEKIIAVLKEKENLEIQTAHDLGYVCKEIKKIYH